MDDQLAVHWDDPPVVLKADCWAGRKDGEMVYVLKLECWNLAHWWVVVTRSAVSSVGWKEHNLALLLATQWAQRSEIM